MTPTPSGYFEPRIEPHCDHCGFPLRGLPEEGVCPECGTAYTPTSASRLQTPPSVGEALTTLLAPWFVLGGVALVAMISGGARLRWGGIIFGAVLPPLCAIWAGYRTRRYARALLNEVFSQRAVKRRPIGFVLTLLVWFGTAVLAAGLLVTVAGLLLYGAWLVDRPLFLML